MLEYPFVYIDGQWRPPDGRARIDVRSPSTEEAIGSVGAGTAADVDRAVESAARALPAWSATSPGDRAAWLSTLADGLEARQAQIARVISEEVGTPIRISTPIQAGQPVAIARYYADLARRFRFESPVGHSLIVREPWGVVGAITPWNYPLHQILAKVAAALAAGCTVVLKPSEVAPLNACLLADICLEIGLPAGVLNIVNGSGSEVGEAIVHHPRVDMVSFTGSVRTGRRILSIAAESIKKVTLELGGKSACVLLDDAPLDRAVPAGVKNALLNSGQTCSAWTRMVVPRAHAGRRAGPGRPHARHAAPRRSARPGDAARSPGVGGTAGEGRGLHRQGTRRGRDARDRRRPAGRSPPRLLRRADDLRRRHARDDDRAGRDLRPGARRDGLRHGRRGDRDRQRDDLRARRGRVVR